MKIVRAIEAKEIIPKKKEQNVSIVGQTIAGNDIPMVQLGRKGKPLIVLMARAHPS